MKILIVSLCLLSINLKAQKLDFGVLSGFVVANNQWINKDIARLTSGEARVFYPKMSYNINGFLSLKSSGFLGLSIEPGFIQKGSAYEDNDVKLRQNYIQIPVLVDIYLADKLFLSIGPEFAYLLNAKLKYSTTVVERTDYYKNFELSGLIGINYNINDKVGVGFRYNHGLTTTFTIAEVDDYANPTGRYLKEYNQYFQLIIRYGM